MNPRFAIEREKHNKLFYKKYENDKCYPHFHSQIELYFITDGEMEVIINSQQKVLKRGEMAVSLSYDTHQYKTSTYSKSAVFIIPVHMAGDFSDLISKHRAVYPFITCDECVEFIRECIDKINTGNLLELEIFGYVCLILGRIYKNISLEPTKKQISSNLLSKILFYLNEHFIQDISLGKMSSDLGYSSCYISRYFKSCIHIGFNDYVNMLRIRYFITILAKNDYHITECAFESGFNSIRTFYRAFEKEFNMSPAEYIKKRI